jgi:hypothetical protein
LRIAKSLPNPPLALVSINCANRSFASDHDAETGEGELVRLRKPFHNVLSRDDRGAQD